MWTVTRRADAPTRSRIRWRRFVHRAAVEADHQDSARGRIRATFTRYAQRCTTTRVLPEPGPASTSSLRSVGAVNDRLLDRVAEFLDD